MWCSSGLRVAQRYDGGGRIHTERSANCDELKGRVVALLVAFSNHFGTPHPRGILIEASLSMDGIAKQVSSNRRSIARVLSDLYAAAALVRVGRKFVVLQPERLLRQSRGANPALSFSSETPWAER